MKESSNYILCLVGEDGLVLYDAASSRQVRDICTLRRMVVDQMSYVEQLVSVTSAQELVAMAFPNNPRLPVGRPAVICGNEWTRLWYRFCRDADAELLKSAAIARCNIAVTDS